MCWFIGHDYKMEFPFKDRPMDWEFTCSRCGDKTTDQYRAL